jgi:hypothetical protein
LWKFRVIFKNKEKYAKELIALLPLFCPQFMYNYRSELCAYLKTGCDTVTNRCSSEDWLWNWLIDVPLKTGCETVTNRCSSEDWLWNCD